MRHKLMVILNGLSVCLKHNTVSSAWSLTCAWVLLEPVYLPTRVSPTEAGLSRLSNQHTVGTQKMFTEPNR